MSIIFFSCERSFRKLPNYEQRQKITCFFEELLLEHGGAYTLFGSKPITVEDLLDVSEDKLKELHKYLDAHPELDYILVDRKLDEGWREWKNFSCFSLSRDYILTELTLPESSMIIFINVPLVVRTLRKYYDDFKEVIGADFDPIEVVEELRQGENIRWQKLVSNYKTLGILAGYGHQNATLFESPSDKQSAASENNDPRLKADCYFNNRPFRIPVFATLDKNESAVLIKKYRKEREKIKRHYIGKDFLDVTLEQLKSGPR